AALHREEGRVAGAAPRRVGPLEREAVHVLHAERARAARPRAGRRRAGLARLLVVGVAVLEGRVRRPLARPLPLGLGAEALADRGAEARGLVARDAGAHRLGRIVGPGVHVDAERTESDGDAGRLLVR